MILLAAEEISPRFHHMYSDSLPPSVVIDTKQSSTHRQDFRSDIITILNNVRDLETPPPNDVTKTNEIQVKIHL